MRFFALFARRRPAGGLSERQCYLRLHGERGEEIHLLPTQDQQETPTKEADGTAASFDPSPVGPTEEGPALHLAFPLPREAARMTGEDIRLDLLRRMQTRSRHGDDQAGGELTESAS